MKTISIYLGFLISAYLLTMLISIVRQSATELGVLINAVLVLIATCATGFYIMIKQKQ